MLLLLDVFLGLLLDVNGLVLYFVVDGKIGDTDRDVESLKSSGEDGEDGENGNLEDM